MKKMRQPRFTLVKPVRFAPEEWERILARAAELRLPPSTYVRQTALGYRLSGRINSRAIAELGRIGNNLNQLTRVTNATRRIDQSRRLKLVLNELTEAMRSLV
jgi:arginyl-tRNA--protein-N-Asp/Glu arginylyltransferase